MLFWHISASHSITVRIHNSDRTPLTRLVVEVTGRTYPIGDLAPGSARAVIVSPTSESGVAVSFADAQGRARHLDAGGYFEPGESGTIVVDVTAVSADIVLHDVTNAF